MHLADLDAVMAVQAACYPPSMQEPRAVVRARLLAAASSCAVAFDGDGVCGYLFAYPSRLGAVTDLGAPFAPPPQPDTLYLHDLSVAPRAHGRGLARALVEHLLATGRAQGLRHAALVSVQDSERFWTGFGFRPSRAAGADAGLATYPGAAVYMARALHQLSL
ncbi:GNAT family N-acetyltransferase [Massilia sp. YIM B02443]|uniref:GNAT family N-acetyltransferase n=1 Tax=Massilia sp. YIM B02443 TaxID=3050127 RepID=UPI0025B6DE20|nr:GNAT family N-acetyltransferase [Massilia sp. YIM B02443]MDN4039474.1 GNAT family N-acetyltransferase [Massilia sp. YIM B02443]